jgi:hypothetical protein
VASRRKRKICRKGDHNQFWLAVDSAEKPAQVPGKSNQNNSDKFQRQTIQREGAFPMASRTIVQPPTVLM